MSEYIPQIILSFFTLLFGVVITALIRPLRRDVRQHEDKINNSEKRIVALETIAKNFETTHKDIKITISEIDRKITSINNNLRNGARQ